MQSAFEVDQNVFEIPDQFKQRLIEATQVSWYGRQFFTGLNAYSGDHGTLHRIKTYAAAVFGSFFFGATSYFSIDGSVRMVATSLQQDPISSDVGHGGEWGQQPFQYGLAIHMYLISAFTNRGCLEDVKTIYRDIIEHLINEEGKDITAFYHKLEDDILYLMNRSFSKANILEARVFLSELFQKVDLNDFPCRPLELDRAVITDYKKILKQLKESDSWTLSNIAGDIDDGFHLLKQIGIGQTIEKSAGVLLFDAAMLASVAFMLWGMTIVIDEVFVSRTSPESSGHVSEWSINILTNFFLMHLVYSWSIKREITLHKTRRVMMNHFQQGDLEMGVVGPTGESKNRLIESCNHYLDQLAQKCQFNTLPSQYRLNL